MVINKLKYLQFYCCATYPMCVWYVYVLTPVYIWRLESLTKTAFTDLLDCFWTESYLSTCLPPHLFLVKGTPYLQLLHRFLGSEVKFLCLHSKNFTDEASSSLQVSAVDFWEVQRWQIYANLTFTLFSYNLEKSLLISWYCKLCRVTRAIEFILMFLDRRV